MRRVPATTFWPGVRTNSCSLRFSWSGCFLDAGSSLLVLEDSVRIALKRLRALKGARDDLNSDLRWRLTHAIFLWKEREVAVAEFVFAIAFLTPLEIKRLLIRSIL